MTEQQSMFPEYSPNFDLDQYFTPPELAREFVSWAIPGYAEIPNMHILEPSAGTGALSSLVDNAGDLTVIEVDPRHMQALNKAHLPAPNVHIERCDFLKRLPAATRFDVALLNPPYSTERAIDAKFVRKAADESTRVCAIVRAVFLNGVDRKAICQDHVIYTRIKYLARRPRFGGEHGAKTDFIFIECRKRQEGEVQGAAGVEFG